MNAQEGVSVNTETVLSNVRRPHNAIASVDVLISAELLNIVDTAEIRVPEDLPARTDAVRTNALEKRRLCAVTSA